MTSNTKITTLSINDWEPYKELRLHALKDAPLAFSSSFEDALNKVDGHWMGHLKDDKMSISLFAKSGGKLVGMGAAIFDKKRKTRHIAELVGFYVNPDYRGQGIASKLIEEIIKRIQERPEIKKIKLSVITTQKAGVKLYEKYDFKIAGELKKEFALDGKHYDMYIMERIL